MNLLTAVSQESDDLQTLLQSTSSVLDNFQLPCPLQKFSNNLTVDAHASELLPYDAPSNLIPLVCTGDGNCLFNTFSIHLVGHEALSTELRVRAAVALLQLKNEFTNTNSEAVRQLIREQCVLYSPFGIDDHHISQHQISDLQILTVFKTEVVNTLTDRTWSGMWQVIGIATALQMSVISVYPNFNIRIRDVFNTTVQPLIGSSNYTLSLLWSGYVTGSTFHPNHFVPLVELQKFNQPPLPAALSTASPKRSFEHTNQKKTKKLKQTCASHTSITSHSTKSNYVASFAQQSTSQSSTTNDTSVTPSVNETINSAAMKIQHLGHCH